MNVWSDREFIDNVIHAPIAIAKDFFVWLSSLFEPKPSHIVCKRVWKPKTKRNEPQPAISQGTGNSVLNQIQAKKKAIPKPVFPQDEVRPLVIQPQVRKPITIKQEDDLTSYEYINDGKRMCFVNYLTGHRVYHEDHLFHELKKKMLFY